MTIVTENRYEISTRYRKYWPHARPMLIVDAIASMRGICTRWPRWKVNNPEGNSTSASMKWKTPDSLICESYRLRHSLLISRLLQTMSSYVLLVPDSFRDIHRSRLFALFFFVPLMHVLRTIRIRENSLRMNVSFVSTKRDDFIR